jgi:protein-S-isoprenylcysteine O-methyltransferase Ste14
MPSTVLALVLTVAWLVLVAGLRAYLRAKGTSEPAVRLREPAGTPQWWAKVIAGVGLVLAFAGPLAELRGLAAIPVLDQTPVRSAGVVLVVVGVAATLAAQWAMGDSWRGDVDPDVRTALVTTGPFRVVRNPILSSTALTALGLTLMVPNVIMVAMLIAFLTSQQILVRLVEEPYLLRVHGDAYRRYAERTGRFVPGIDRLPRRPRAGVDGDGERGDG